jgi:hypothetical protein
VIISGGYGVARAQELIGWYDEVLRLADWPRGLLESALIEQARRAGSDTVVAFVAATTPYAQLVRRTPWRDADLSACLVTISGVTGGAMAEVPRRLGLAFAAFWDQQHDNYPPCTTAGTAGMNASRQRHLDEFYRLLDQLAAGEDGPRRLKDCTGRDGWTRRGVYFFLEGGETRVDGTSRVVRVGTHALSTTSKTTMWGRLRQYRGRVGGRNPGGGNHRSSIFRRHVGTALIRRDGRPDGLLDSWASNQRHPQWAAFEDQLERAVSLHIGAMPFPMARGPQPARRQQRPGPHRTQQHRAAVVRNWKAGHAERWLAGPPRHQH